VVLSLSASLSPLEGLAVGCTTGDPEGVVCWGSSFGGFVASEGLVDPGRALTDVLSLGTTLTLKSEINDNNVRYNQHYTCQIPIKYPLQNTTSNNINIFWRI
jgi:hypothetical protein